jgi:hypothetical protein
LADEFQTEVGSSVIAAEGEFVATFSDSVALTADRMTLVEPQDTPGRRDSGSPGSVVVEAGIRADGTFGVLRVIEPLGYGIGEEVIAAVSQWRSSPRPTCPAKRPLS